MGESNNHQPSGDGDNAPHNEQKKKDIVNACIEMIKVMRNVSLLSITNSIKSLKDNVHKVATRIMDEDNVFKNISLGDNKMTKDTQYYVKLVEDLSFMIRTLTRGGKVTKMSVMEAIILLFKLRTNKSFVGSVYESFFKNHVLEEFSELEEYEMQGFEESITDARMLFESYKNIKSSAMVVKIYKCLLFGVSISMFDSIGLTFDKLGYTAIEAAALKKKLFKRDSFFEVVCDTMLFIVERGYQVYKTRDVTTIFHSQKTYTELKARLDDLKRKSHLLTNPEDHGFTESWYRSELDKVLESLESVKKHGVGLAHYEKEIVTKEYHILSMLRDELTTRSAARRMRHLPFGVLIYGDSGIGKTTITEMIFNYFAKKRGLGTESEFKYTVNPVAKHWDGFTTSCHTIVLDDVASVSPNMGDMSSLDCVIQVMNPQSYCPPQASLEDKGRTPCKPELVIATSNVKNLHAHHYFSCPSAVQRRFPFIITPTVKEEYKNSRGFLDSSLCENVKAYPELWTFKVERVNISPINESGQSTLATLELVSESMDQVEFFSWLSNAIDHHYANKERVDDSLKRMREEELCGTCSLPMCMCSCTESQSAIQQIRSAHKMVAWCLKISSYFLTFFLIMHVLYVKFRIWLEGRSLARTLQLHNSISLLSTKRAWANMGAKVQNKMGDFAAIASVALIVAGLYKLSKVTSDVSMEGEETRKVGKRPKADTTGRENVWYKNDFELTTFDVSRPILSSKSMDRSTFAKHIVKNVMHVQYLTKRGDDWYMKGKLTCLRGCLYLGNNHIFPKSEMPIRLQVTQMAGKDGVSTNHICLISESDVVRDPDRDLIFIEIKTIPPKKDITKFIAPQSFDGKINGYYLSRLNNGKEDMNLVDNLMLDRDFHAQPRNMDPIRIPVWTGIPRRKTVNGECGMPLLANTEMGNIFLGIHCMGKISEKRSYAHAVYKEYIDANLKNFSQSLVEEGVRDMLSGESAPRIVGELSKKSPLRYIDQGSAAVMGSFQGFRTGGKSRVEKTILFPSMRKRGFEDKYTAPVMKGWEPWRIALLDNLNPVIDIDSDILKECARCYITDVEKRIQDPSMITDHLIILDDFTTLNGAPGVPFIDKINRNTSTGDPYKKSKKYFMKSIPPKHGMQDPVELDAEIEDRIDKIYNKYKNYERAHPTFCAHLKDEAVSMAKAQQKKTRVFTGAPLDYSFLVRKFTLSFARVVQTERLAFECAAGTIAQSTEWEGIYDHITKFGNHRMVAGDYKAYDKKMSPKEILMAFEVIKYFCKKSGNYSDEDLKVIDCIAMDTAFCNVDYNGDYVELFGSMPSGNPLTVILNSIVNSLRMRYVYYKLNPNKEVESYIENVALITYGDDNAMGVNEAISWYDHTTVAEEFKKIGIVYTMADKERESVPFIHISELDFLKRKFVYDKDVGAVLAPLDEDSIEKGLMTWVRSKTVSSQAQAISIIANAIREYFFHGKEKFENRRNMFIEIIKECDLNIWCEDSTLPTWDELKSTFWRNSRRREKDVDIQSVPELAGSAIGKLEIYALFICVIALHIILIISFFHFSDELTNLRRRDRFVVHATNLDGQPMDNTVFFFETLSQCCLLAALIGRSTKMNQIFLRYKVEIVIILFLSHGIIHIPLTFFFIVLKLVYKGLWDKTALVVCRNQNHPRDVVTVVQKMEQKMSKAWTFLVTHLSVPQSPYLGKVFKVGDQHSSTNWISMSQLFLLLWLAKNNKEKRLLFCQTEKTKAQVLEQEVQIQNNSWPDEAQRNIGISHKDFPITIRPYHDNCKLLPTTDVAWQSEPMQGLTVQPTGTAPVAQQHENVAFADQDEEPTSEIRHDMDMFKMDLTPNVSLGSFMKRPVKIYSFTWSDGLYVDPAVRVLYPWSNYFSKASIKSKLDNYYLLRCNLRLKFVINASPFYYGAIMVSYQPLTSENVCRIEAVATGNNRDMVSRSQRPHIYLYPQDGQGGELLLPFISPKNWLDATDASELLDFGLIRFKSFTPLLNANGITGTGVEISVFAWAEDVELSGTTSELAMQSEPIKISKKKKVKKSDEYSEDGPVSKPASAISRAAGMLTDIPVIGPFATATEHASGAVASIARALGFTNVPVIEDVHAYRPTPYPQFASTAIGIPVEKLTLDPKNELTIDPRVTGADCGDEMLISDIVQRECFIWDTTWAISDNAEANIMGARVAPFNQLRASTSGGETTVWQGPMSFVSRCFQYWRGDIIYRFKFLCTKFHKGRVAISFDPIGAISSLSGDYTTETFTRIVDITQETDVEIRVPFMQPTGFLNVDRYNVSEAMSTTAGTGDLTSINGYITMKVLNTLSAPTSTADCRVLVFMRGAENLEFGGPALIPREFSPYAMQSEPVKLDQQVDEEQIVGEIIPTNPNLNLVYFGETVKSIRQLIRRYSKYVRLVADESDAAANLHYTHAFSLPRNNLLPGFDLNGLHNVTGITSGVSEPYNYVFWSFMSWFTQAFIGRTGSINYSIVPNSTQSDSGIGSLVVSRANFLRSRALYSTVQSTSTSAICAQFCDTGNVAGTEGLSVTHYDSLTGPTVSVPMYSRYKFQYNTSGNNALGSTTDETTSDTVRVEVSAVKQTTAVRNLTFDMYTSAGTDYNLVFFLNVPTMYYYDANPAWISQA